MLTHAPLLKLEFLAFVDSCGPFQYRNVCMNEKTKVVKYTSKASIFFINSVSGIV